MTSYASLHTLRYAFRHVYDHGDRSAVVLQSCLLHCFSVSFARTLFSWLLSAFSSCSPHPNPSCSRSHVVLLLLHIFQKPSFRFRALSFLFVAAHIYSFVHTHTRNFFHAFIRSVFGLPTLFSFLRCNVVGSCSPLPRSYSSSRCETEHEGVSRSSGLSPRCCSLLRAKVFGSMLDHPKYSFPTGGATSGFCFPS